MEDLNSLKSEIEKHQKHPKIATPVIVTVVVIFIVFLISIGVYFSSNSNQIKLTITNGSEAIKRLEVRAENAESAQVQGRDSIQLLNKEITIQLEEIQKLQTSGEKKDKNIKELNEKVDSLLRVVNNFQHSDIEPVKRPN